MTAPSFGAIPADLRERVQWVLWKEVRSRGEEQPKKVPFQARFPREQAKTNDPDTWATFDEAVTAYEEGGHDGLGYVFTATDPYIGVDLDVDKDDETASLEDWQARIIQALESYTERSPSGRGAHVILRGVLDRAYKKKGLEIYPHARYFTCTGDHIPETPAEIREANGALSAIVAEHFGVGSTTNDDAVQRSNGAAWLQGERNNRLLSLAGALRRQGFEPDEMLDMLLLANERRCTPPLDRPEIERIAQSVGRYAPGDTGHGLDDGVTLARLTGLSELEYERVREAEAKKLGVKRISVLDRLVAKARGEHGDNGTGRKFETTEIQPWDGPVDGATVLTEIAETFTRYLVLPPNGAETCALWIAHCFAFDVFLHTPRLNITAPEKGCGKTTALDVISGFVPRPIWTENVSTAPFFRLAERDKPTFLMDEYDSYLAADKSGDLRSAVNAGHRQGGQVIRCVGDDHEPAQFTTFSPVVLAGIKPLPSTLYDRSIVIRMSRATTEESTRLDRFRGAHTLSGDPGRKLTRWAAENREALREADPDMGPLYNRVADNWRPLYAVADVIGGPWPDVARHAALASLGDRDEDTLGVELLRDIRDIFEERRLLKMPDPDKMHTAKLVEKLIQLESRPWQDCMPGGRALTDRRLAKTLAEFMVKPNDVRISKIVKKGYRAAQFDDAFARYVDPVESKTPES
jgi:hypothetical protein